MNTYSIELWDFDPAENGTVAGRFCGSLAARLLGGPNTGLTLPQVGRALRRLRQHWCDENILVRREDAVP